MSDRPRVTDLREALLAETLDEVAHLHDTVQALGPKLQAIADPMIETIAEAISEAVTRARKEVSEHARDQATYVEQTMLKDREKFVAEQKAALEALDTGLRTRDAGIVKIMADIVEKTRATFAEEMTQAVERHTNRRPTKERKRAALGALALGMGVGAMGTMGTIILLLRLGVVGVAGAGAGQ